MIGQVLNEREPVGDPDTVPIDFRAEKSETQKWKSPLIADKLSKVLSDTLQVWWKQVDTLS